MPAVKTQARFILRPNRGRFQPLAFRIPSAAAWHTHRQGRPCAHRRHGRNALTSDVEDVILALIHPVNVLRHTGIILSRLGGLDAQQHRNLGMVGGILMDAELDALAILYVELIAVILLLCNLRERLQAPFDQVP